MIFVGPATALVLGYMALGGDFDPALSTAQAPIIGSLSGSSPLKVTPATLQWLSGTASPTLTIATPTTDAPTQQINITGHVPFAGATVNTTPGNVNVNIAAPAAGGSEALFTITRVGVGTLASFKYQAAGSFGLFNLGGVQVLSASSTTAGYGGAVASLVFQASSISVALGSNTGWQLNAAATNFGGGTKVVGIGNAIALPTSIPTSPVYYGNAGAFEIAASGFQFHRLVSAPAITQPAPLTDVATQDLNLTPQAPFASATVNVVGGNVNVNLAVPISGTAESLFKVKRGANTVFALGPDPTSGVNFSAFFLFPYASNLNPTASNATLTVGGGILYISPYAAGSIAFRPGGSGVIGPMTIATTGIQFGSETPSFGSGSKVFGFTDATTIPTTAPAGGFVWYSHSGVPEYRTSANVAVGLPSGTAASATAGAATLSAAPVGFLTALLGGTAIKIPYYAA
jgi:hypothetical protein